MLSVIVPTYNERENVEPLVRRLLAVRALLREPLEVLIADSASPDGTARAADGLLRPEQLGRALVISGPSNLCRAVTEGVRQAQGDLVAVMDADLSHPPELLPALVAAVRHGAEIAIASRYVAGGGIAKWPRTRRSLSWMGNLMARPLVGVRDATSGYFVCRTEALRRLEWQPIGFKILLELLASARPASVREIPYQFADRQRGSSKLGVGTLWCYASQLVRLYVQRGRQMGRKGHEANVAAS